MKNPDKLSFADRKDLASMFQDTLLLEGDCEKCGFSEFLLSQQRAEELIEVFLKQ